MGLNEHSLSAWIGNWKGKEIKDWIDIKAIGSLLYC